MKTKPAKSLEAQLREQPAAWPKTMAELTKTINGLVDQKHDYGTCVYAMSLSAVAAFNYVSHKLGVTGFQASCADLDFLRRTRSMECPFLIIKAEDLVFPQYDVRAKLELWIAECREWVKEEAKKKLKESKGHAHPDVIAHWKKLAR